MRKFILALAVLTAGLSFSLPAARACGDKSLRVGRGVRFRRTTSPASILIYLPSNAPPEAASKAPRLQSFLKKAGHRSRVVQGEGQLSEALGSGQYDLVLSSLSALAGLQRRLADSSSHPALVPLIFKATREEVAAAQRQYRFVVKDAGSGDDYLEAIEGVMKARAQARG